MSSAGSDPRVFRSQLDLLFRRSQASVAASAGFAALALGLMPTTAPPYMVGVWFALVAAGAAFRLVMGRLFLDGRRPTWPDSRWRAIAIAGSLASGALWGFFMVAVAPDWGEDAYPVAAFLYGMVPALSLAANGPLFSAYLALVAPMLVPHAFELLLQAHAGEARMVAGLGTLLYLAILVITAREVERQIVAGLRRGFENRDLIARLEASNAELALEARRREATERSLREATAAAETANAAKSTFLARVSHEVRTPLNGILGITEILRSTPLTKDQAEHADTIEEAGRSLLRVINDILDFSQAEAGRLSLYRADFSVRSVLDRVVALLRPRAEKQGLTLAVEVAPEVPEVMSGDAGRLRQVLINLIGNALKFTSAGGVRVRVSPRMGPKDPFDLLFEVRDTGMGIAPEDQERIFQPFSQAGDARDPAREGTGLGLAITRHIVELMEGQIGVESEKGQGACFWFTGRFVAATGQVARPGRARTGELPGRLRGRVLLVDDNAVNRKVAASFVERLGCSYREAVDGAEAVRLVREGGFDAILMDCEMPEVDGYEATRRIREDERLRGEARPVPIVAVTASALPEDRERALAAGMTDYLSKPFSLVELFRTLRPLLTAVS